MVSRLNSFFIVYILLHCCNEYILSPSNRLLDVEDLAESVLSIVDRSNNSLDYLVESNGYHLETYYVTTTDGYILNLSRIYRYKGDTPPEKRVFLQHGILTSAADWIVTGPNKGLAYILVDRGYDVWMGNARGNTYSRNHETLSPSSSAFWQFSWHQIGTIDIPQMIDYVLSKTGSDKLYYIGHSQGTTAYYVMTSCLPEYNEKIKVAISLAPIAFMNHLVSPILKVISTFNGPLELFASLIGLHEFLPNTALFKLVASDVLCRQDSLSQSLCTNTLFVICGFSIRQMNTTLLPTIAKFTPAGSSTKQFLHYAQEIVSGKFRQYDFRFFGNLKNYGRPTPPDYDLSKITTPTHLFCSRNDWLSSLIDVDRLCSGLGDACEEKYLIPDPEWNHLDYLYGIDAPDLVYEKVLSVLTQY